MNPPRVTRTTVNTTGTSPSPTVALTLTTLTQTTPSLTTPLRPRKRGYIPNPRVKLSWKKILISNPNLKNKIVWGIIEGGLPMNTSTRNMRQRQGNPTTTPNSTSRSSPPSRRHSRGNSLPTMQRIIHIKLMRAPSTPGNSRW